MIYAHLVMLGLDSPIFLTDYHRDYVYDGDNYTHGSVKIDGSVKQKVDLGASEFTVELDATTDTFVNVFAANEYKNKPCKITRIELDSEGNIVDSYIYYDGLMDSFTFSNSVKSTTIKLKLSSIFARFTKPMRLNLNRLYSDSISNKDKKRWGKS